MDKSEIIQKWIEGTLSDEERTHFEQSEEYRSLVKVLDRVVDLKAPDYDVDGELSKLKRKLKPQKAKRIVFNRLVLRIAALVVVTFGLTYFWFAERTTDLTNISSEVTPELALPDNSEVKLNAKSSLSFDPKNWHKDRNVNLTGEAYFEVAKGAVFKVQTVSGTVQVVGTSFNVKDRDGVLEVTCYTGQVKVSNGKDQLMLRESEKVVLTKQAIQEKIPISDSIPTWLSGKSAFESTPLIHVLSEFERQYDVTIKLNNVDSLSLFSGTFTHTDLKIGLESITLPLHLSYQITKDHIVLSKLNK